MVSIVDVAVAGVFITACGLLTPNVPLGLVLFVVFVYGLARSMQRSPRSPMRSPTAANERRQHDMERGGADDHRPWHRFRRALVTRGFGFPRQRRHHAHMFTLDDFRLAFLGAGLLTLVSIYGYVKLSGDAGHRLSNASR